MSLSDLKKKCVDCLKEIEVRENELREIQQVYNEVHRKLDEARVLEQEAWAAVAEAISRGEK